VKGRRKREEKREKLRALDSKGNVLSNSEPLSGVADEDYEITAYQRAAFGST